MNAGIGDPVGGGGVVMGGGGSSIVIHNLTLKVVTERVTDEEARRLAVMFKHYLTQSDLESSLRRG